MVPNSKNREEPLGQIFSDDLEAEIIEFERSFENEIGEDMNSHSNKNEETVEKILESKRPFNKIDQLIEEVNSITENSEETLNAKADCPIKHGGS